MNKNNLSTIFTYAIEVRKDKGQKILERLKKRELFDNSRGIIENNGKLWIPVKKRILKAKKISLPLNPSFSSLHKEFGLKSFDVIGDIIVIFIPDELKNKKYEIANYLMTLYPKVKAVYCEIGQTKGEYRVQTKKLLLGEGSETIHHENGLKFKLDITKVFFSPRQATERSNLVKYVKPGDRVCVFFSGISPIPIYLAKFSEAKQIVGIELNEIAHNYAIQNIKLNNIQGVKLLHGDVVKFVEQLLPEEVFDLVIMPLPKYSENYIQLVKRALTEKGRVIIYLPGSDKILKNHLQEINKEGLTVLEVKKGNNIAPKERRYTIHAILD
ncbi:MAG: class I SAM-dependent methyltransferase family protein [Candidatus Thorarchaeota archaeon]